MSFWIKAVANAIAETCVMWVIGNIQLDITVLGYELLQLHMFSQFKRGLSNAVQYWGQKEMFAMTSSLMCKAGE